MSGWDPRYMTSVDKAFAEEMQQSFENQRRIREAALDMLEALEEVVRAFGRPAPNTPAEAFSDEIAALNQAIKAIAKAKGEEG